MILELIKAAALLLSLSLLQSFVVRFSNKNKRIKQVLSGVVFGGVCIVGMVLPIEVTPGVIFDPRTVVLSMAGLFGGPVVSGVAAAIAGGYRLFLGGGGVYVGVAVVIASTSLGLVYRYGVNKGWTKVNITQLLLFGLLVHVVEVLLFTQLPAEIVDRVMATVAFPLIITFTPATAFLGMLLKDIEDRVKTEYALKESEGRLSHHLQNTPLAAISWDKNFKVTQWNKTAEKIFGYLADEAMGKHAMDIIIQSDSRIKVDSIFDSLMAQKGGTRSTNENITRDGRLIICDWYNTPILNEVGKAIGVASLCEDVTAQKESEALIWKQANYDSLTGLANRQMAQDRLDQEIRKVDRSNKSLALIYLDLDGFKDINDTLGHVMGDILLVEMANRLRACVRDADTVGRIGGDEFIIIMGGLDGPDNVDQIANKLLKKTVEPFKVGQETAFISASIGITFYPGDAAESVELFKNADQAMYAAKNKGGNKFQYFTQSMQHNALSRMTLLNDLRAALPGDQFRLHYQPIIRLVNGDIEKAEALIRWQHPERGLIGPIEFIPVTEESRMILEIGDWVFREATQQSARWRAAFDPDFQISVNTSPVQYRHEDFKASDWLEHLQSLKLPADAVVVEITEGTLMETHLSIASILLEFRDAGIQVSLDDFGTGYSSLAYLQKLDIDYLKIDKSFVDNLEPNSNDLALCEAIIVMAHKLDLKVIAEGIETTQQRDLLISAGCDYGQGYLFSKPIPANEFEKLFKPGKNKEQGCSINGKF